MDRLAWYYHAQDEQGLEQALAVAAAHAVDLDRIEAWSRRERAQEKFERASAGNPGRSDVVLRSGRIAPYSARPSSWRRAPKSNPSRPACRCSWFSISLSRTSTASRPRVVRTASRGDSPPRAGSTASSHSA